jgi:hypothetical protein
MLCSQGVVIIRLQGKMAVNLERANRARDVAYLYMYPGHEERRAAAKSSEAIYAKAYGEWLEHWKSCENCREASCEELVDSALQLVPAD